MRVMSAVLLVFSIMTASVSAADPIMIGAFLPMTGNVAAYGQMDGKGFNSAKRWNPKRWDGPWGLKVSGYQIRQSRSCQCGIRLIEKENVVALIREMISGNT